MAQKSDEPDVHVRCECGFEAHGPLAMVAPLVQKHGREAHNMKVTRAQVAAMAKQS
jgi:hypothetical protein